ncbi:MAG: hypothetical protein FJ303_18595 [Planctomycetes bacterium]|nr:hypothetical protein [Planctomycetota bacterium]
MRATLWCSIIGFVSVTVLAGCGTLQNPRVASVPAKRPLLARGDAAKRIVVAETTHVRVDGASAADKPVIVTKDAPTGKTNVDGQDQVIVARETKGDRGAKPMPMGEPIRRVAAPLPELVDPRPVTKKDPALPAPNAEIVFGADEAYRTITGQVEVYRKVPRLRFGHVAQEDAYGGVVVLEGGADVSRLEDGKLVRVTGVLVPPANRTASATFRVKTVEILD